MARTRLYLGGIIDRESRERIGEDVSLATSELTTHGVIVGMTGSGKTGLGIVALEEALSAGVPALIIDPKGDMTNLLLTFPDLSPDDFEPWMDEQEARRIGVSTTELASQTAKRWRDGLASWDLDGSDIARLRAACEMTVFTPGSTAGVPLDMLGSLDPPDGDMADEETIREEVSGLVTGILSLAGVRADPMVDREAILLSHLLHDAWRRGEGLTLEDLVGRVHHPPMRKMGVFDMDTFFPERDRLALAMRLNNLVASPSFSAWRSGVPLDPRRLLESESGRPRAAILYLAHLSDDERQFVVSAVLSKVITWMRQQSGTGDLRALIYMDEIFGFAPPTANPPAKQPILTLFKSARAFGLGMLLATQNPVDLDYKAMANAGAWFVGRLQTERDKARILEALRSASGEANVAELDTLISGLTLRQFLLYRARTNTPSLFTTRWAMSYMYGPLTREQIARLAPDMPRPPEATAIPPAEGESGSETDGATPVMPPVARGTPVLFLDPAAPWTRAVGAAPRSTVFAAGLAARVHLTYRDRAARVDHRSEWEAVFFPLRDPFDPASATSVDHDDRDFHDEPPLGARYLVPDVDLSDAAWLRGVTSSLRDHLHHTESLTVLHNPHLGLYSGVDESPEEFRERCLREAEDRADDEVAKAVARFEKRIASGRDRIEAAEMRVRETELDVATRRREEIVSGAATLLGALTRRGRTATAASGATRRRSMTQRAEQRVETAQARVDREVSALHALEAERDATIHDARSTWTSKAATIEERRIGPGKTTMRVDTVAIVWIPVD